jgi:type I restriction enzyme S subunit
MKAVFKECLISEVCHVFSGNSINEKQKADNYTNIVEGTPYIATKDVGYDFKINYENGITIPTRVEAQEESWQLATERFVLLISYLH